LVEEPLQPFAAVPQPTFRLPQAAQALFIGTPAVAEAHPSEPAHQGLILLFLLLPQPLIMREVTIHAATQPHAVVLRLPSTTFPLHLLHQEQQLYAAVPQPTFLLPQVAPALFIGTRAGVGLHK